MKKLLIVVSLFLLLLQMSCTSTQQKAEEDNMAWWRDARFGLFIHWGLYAIPAGEWNGETNHAEWIRNTAEIPIETYDKFVDQFNPVNFNADEWVKMAKNAGMKYIVITSKHHDGFCLFDSKETEYDVMSTPFQRDILKELADACKKEGLKMCWYHSIMDWHHPDYLPRRPWETDRPTEGADYDRYVQYMKNQLAELTSNYGDIGVLWFDGEWESTWTHERGVDLYNYVKSLQPNIIINNRVDKGRSGMEGMTRGDEFKGDFGTPEQEIPATGLPGVDWETCMTMNDHWGYNKNDYNWKSKEDLIQKLADIASKGGNFLLNIGPKADGTFPQESIDRLAAFGDWMHVNGESIYGTSASPFKTLPWGRCTQKAIKDGTRLYLHVFDWPTSGKLIVPGIFNEPIGASLLATPDAKLNVDQSDDALVIELPETAPDDINSVVVLDIVGTPDVSQPPVIQADASIFINELNVDITTDMQNAEIRYTSDGTTPSVDSPLVNGQIVLTESATIKARCFKDGKPRSDVIAKTFTNVAPQPPVKSWASAPGVTYKSYQGEWMDIPPFAELQPVKFGVNSNYSITFENISDHFAFDFSGLINIPNDGVYTFYTTSDDGSQLFINDELVVDNGSIHSMEEKHGVIALAKGAHKIRVTYFERDGDAGLQVGISGPGLEKQLIPDSMLFVD